MNRPCSESSTRWEGIDPLNIMDLCVGSGVGFSDTADFAEANDSRVTNGDVYFPPEKRDFVRQWVCSASETAPDLPTDIQKGVEENGSRLPLPGYTLNQEIVQQLDERVMDSHCHIDFINQRLDRKDRVDSWAHMVSRFMLDPYNKFGGLITNFCDPRTWNQKSGPQADLVANLVKEEGVYYTIGCHPHWADQVGDDWIKDVEQTIKEDRGKCVAIGECGLDYGPKNSVPADVQRRVFRDQLMLAAKLCIPVVMHIRDAQREALEVIHEARLPISHYVHRHCFTGDMRELREWLDNLPNSVLGITNLLTYPSSHNLHDVVRNLDMDRIVLETDAPYFTPKGGRGLDNDRRNSTYPPTLTSYSGQPLSQPMHVLNVAAQVAVLKGLTLDEVLRINKRNVRNIYKIRT